MLSNYLKLAFRSLLNNRLYSFINIAGLSVGLSSAILVVLLINDELGFDKFHTNLPNLHLLLQNQTQGGVTYTFESMPGPLAAALRAEMPEVKRVFRYSWRGQHLLTQGEKSTFEQGYYAEPDFFATTSFEALAGQPALALQDAGSVVITERTALKFFGSADAALGKTLRHNNVRDLIIGAVVRDVPTNSTLKFDVVLPFHIYEQENADWVNSNWGSNAMPTWVELQPGADIAALNQKLENFVQSKNPEAAAHVFAYPLSEWHLHSKFKEGKQDGGRITMVWLMGIIGVFVLLIACANFMNLATARSERRAREVGVRKVAGAQRGIIIGQFLSEALVMTFIGLALSVLLAIAALPAFNRISEKELSLGIGNWPIWGSILVLGLFTGLVAGSYPALYLSKFQPIQVLRGSAPIGSAGGGWFRKGLVTFQFFISIMLIISTIVVTRQLDYAQNRPIGYEQEHLIDIPARGDMSGKYEALKNELSQISGVKSVSAGSDDLVQFGSNTSDIEWPGKTADQDFLVSVTSVQHSWTQTAGLKLVEGRDFNPASPSDTLCCLLNETAVRRMGLGDKAIGTVLRDDTTITVIGVVQDFVFNDPFSKPEPMIVYLGRPTWMNYFFVRFQNDDHWRETLAQVEQATKRVNPAYPFEFRFTKDEYQKGFQGVRSTSQMGYIFGGMAIFISCLGLFGLSAFVAERRKKEIGVRKVLGATVANVWLNMSGEFLRPVFWGFLLAAPLAGFAMSKLLATLEYRIELSWWMFAAAGLIAFAIALLTVSFQSVRAALANPVQSLRSE